MSFSEDGSDNRCRRLQSKSSQGSDGHNSMIYTDPDAYPSYPLESGSPSQRNLRYRNSANMNAIFGTEDPNSKYGLHYENPNTKSQIKDKGESNSSANMNAIFGTNNPTPRQSHCRHSDNIGDIINDGCTVGKQEDTPRSDSQSSGQSSGMAHKGEPPAPTPAPPTPRKRVPPGGYSSGLW